MFLVGNKAGSRWVRERIAAFSSFIVKKVKVVPENKSRDISLMLSGYL
jgi:hypothetical protein